jgi:hypothetical protein
VSVPKSRKPVGSVNPDEPVVDGPVGELVIASGAKLPGNPTSGPAIQGVSEDAETAPRSRLPLTSVALGATPSLAAMVKGSPLVVTSGVLRTASTVGVAVWVVPATTRVAAPVAVVAASTVVSAAWVAAPVAVVAASTVVSAA